MKTPKPQVKSFDIDERLVYQAWEKVRANHGAAGVDADSINQFRERERDNLYKLWNRMSSGSYFPGPVRAVEVPEDHGKGVRVLGVPDVKDRVAQTAVAMLLEAGLEPIFHPDSYRPARSAHDTLAVCGRRCWEKDPVLERDTDCDVRAFFDSVPHDLLMKAVAHHTSERWVVLYISRWLKAPMQMLDGTLVAREDGTPQGSPISPVLANLFMHYASDTGMEWEHPDCPFERDAVDIVEQAQHPRALIRAWHLRGRTGEGLSSIASQIKPVVRGWINNYGASHRSDLRFLAWRIKRHLTRWATLKFKRFRKR